MLRALFALNVCSRELHDDQSYGEVQKMHPSYTVGDGKGIVKFL